MKISPRPVEAQSINFARAIYIQDIPDVCPLCHRHVVPQELGFHARGREGTAPVEAVYRCTNGSCQRIFLGIFLHIPNPQGPDVRSDRPHFGLSMLTPSEPQPPSVPDLVAAVSPNFVRTYNQALAAEVHHLEQLAGIGLRKALEFLVKDFAIREHPGDAEQIKSKPLAACISEYLDDPNVKRCATRATWLGNDETHYVRKWEDKDIEDLKILIRLTLNWLDNVLLTEKYASEMPDKPGKT